MFTYYPVDSMYEPRISQPRTRNFYQPTQHSRPCSYYHNNTSPFYNFYSLHNYPTYYDEDYEDQLLQERLNNYKRQQEERERSKRFYERKSRERQARQSGASTFIENHQQPKKSFKVKIQGDDETRSTIDKSQAARKIFNFIKNQTANKQTRKILNNLRILRIIENELKEIHKTKFQGSLIFDDEYEKQVLPISAENKQFLKYEDRIVKLLDKLDRVQSEGVDIVRERRKFLVKFAQTLLEELDNEKEKQWKERKELNENSDVVMNENDVAQQVDISDVVMDDKADEDVAQEIDVPEPSSVASENDSDVTIDDKVDETDIACFI